MKLPYRFFETGMDSQQGISENVWRIIIISFTLIVILFTIYCLSSGITIIFMHLYYFPIILMAYHYQKKGIILSSLLGILYLLMVSYYTYPNMEEILGAFVRFMVFVGIATVVALLSVFLTRHKTTYQILFSNVKSCILITEKDGSIVDANPQCSNFLGYEKDDIIELKLSDICKDKEIIPKILNQDISKRYEKNFEVRLSTKDGTEKIAYMSTGIVPENRIVLICTDVTENLALLNEIRELNQIQNSIISNANVWLMLLDKKGRVRLWNKAAEEISGFHESEVAGSGNIWKKLYPEPEYRREITKKILEIINSHNYLQNLETTIRTRNGDEKVILWNTKGLSDESGDVSSFVAIGVDITETIEIKKALQESEEKFRGVAERSSDIILLTDQRDVTTYVSPSVKRILGYEPDEMIGKRPEEFVHQDDLELINETNKTIASEEALKRLQIRIRRKNGEYAIMEMSVSPIIDNSVFKGVQVMGRDVTETVRIKKALQKSEEKFRGVAERSSDIIMLTDQKGKTTYVSPSVRRILGYEPEEMLETTAEEFVHPDDLGTVYETIKKTASGESVQGILFRVRKKTGDYITMEMSISPITENGEFKGIQVMGRDVTETLEAKKALQESEEKFRGVAERSSDIIMLTDQEGLVTYVSPSVKRILGYEPDYMFGKSPDLLIDPEDIEKTHQAINRVASGENNVELHIRLIKKDGEYATIEMTGSPIIENGVYKGIQVLGRDITEKIAAQERIRNLLHLQEEQLFIINNSPAIAFLWKAEENWPIESVSDNISHFGYIPDDFLSGRIVYSTIIHPDDLERVAEEVEYNSENHIDEFYQCYRIFGKDREEYWIDDFTRIRRNDTGEITHYQGIVLDITERKKAEEALQESEITYRTLFESAGDAIFIVKDGVFIDCNHRTETIFGVSRDQIIGHSPAEFSPERQPDGSLSSEKVQESDAAALSGVTQSFEWIHTRLDGTPFYAEVTLNRIILKGEYFLQAIVRDITNRKEAEEALAREKANTDYIIESLPGICYIINTDGRFVRWNKNFETVTGYSTEEVAQMTPQNFIVEDDRKNVSAAIQKAFSEGYAETEANLLTKDNKEIPFFLTGNIKLIDGIPQLLGIGLDISDQKEAEEALAREKANTDYILESLPGMFYMFYMLDTDGRFVRWNRNLETLTGYSSEEVVRMKPLEFVDEHYHEEVSAALDKAFKEGYADVEATIITKEGEKIPFFFSAHMEMIDDVPYILGMGLDITESKKAEEEIRKLAAVVRYSREMIALTTLEGIIIFMNEAGARMLGRSVEDTINKDLREVIPVDQAELIDSVVIPSLIETGIWEGDLRYNNIKTGKLVDARAMTFTINDPETGTPLYLANVSTDITDRKKAEDALKEVNKKLNLLGSITRHDILNQVTGAEGFIQLLMMSGEVPEDSKTEDYLTKINGAVDTIKRQILFTKDYKDLGEQEPQWYNVGKIIEDVAGGNTFGELKVENEVMNLEIYADPLFEKVIFNLFDNAVKHGEKITTIKFTSEETPEGLTLICEDDGAGIPEEFKEKIFKRQYYKNTGLGLFLSREILSITGISIKETGAPGKGARFEIIIPKNMYHFV